MNYLLDTDICSAHLKGKDQVTDRMIDNAGSLSLSTVTLGELYTWTCRKKAPARRRRALEKFLSAVTILNVDRDVALKFGELHAQLLDRGRPTPSLDLLIASTAILHGLTLVTHNTQDFEHVPGLVIEDWLD